MRVEMPGLDAIGGYQPTSEGRVLALALFSVALVLVAALERLQFRLRATEGALWWASNGRDVLNALAVAVMTFALSMVGFNGPIAFCIAATQMAILSALQTSLGDRRSALLWSVMLAFALGAPVMLAPRAVHEGFQRMLRALF
jgi:hypothetical protein